MAGTGLVGVQMSTIKNKVEELGAYGTLEACAKLGYRCVEVSQIPMTEKNIQDMKKASDDFGIKIAAVTPALEPAPHGAQGESLATHFDKVVADCRALGCDMMRLGMLPVQYMGSYEKALRFAQTADEMAQRLKQEGIDLYYHNHHIEFVKYSGEYLLDIIRENAPHMGFELDIHWIHRGGEQPVAWIEKYAGCIRLLHLKDYRIAPMELPEEGPVPPEVFSAAFGNVVQFAEVGEGSLPVKACVEAALAGGSEYFLVEQDATYGRDPFESLRISRDNLVALGYGHWFAQ